MHIGFLFTKHVLHFLYNACGKWYFQSKISPFGLIQAGHTKLENGVSLSMGIVEKIWNMFCNQGANVHLSLNSRMFWCFRLTLVPVAIVYFFRQRRANSEHAKFTLQKFSKKWLHIKTNWYFYLENFYPIIRLWEVK